MNLPNFFLADVAESTLPPSLITEACIALKANRRRYLAERTTADLIDVIAAVADDWRDPTNPFRQRALDLGPSATRFSRQTLAAGLDAFFGSLTHDTLNSLVLQDLGHLSRLDRPSPDESNPRGGRLALARGPEMLVQVTAGQLPNPAFTSILLGLLTRSAQFIKCASGTSLLPRLLAHSLYEIEPKLGACLEIAEWKGGNRPLEEALFAQADCVTAMGSDETIAAIRHGLPNGVRFLGYGHRLSFGYVARERLGGSGLRRVAAAAADDIVAWDQLGCLSPHLFYVESGGPSSPETFAERLATELTTRELSHPRGRLSDAEAGQIAARRAFYEVRAACLPDTLLWRSSDSTAWTVVFESDPRFQVSCLHRFVYVKPVPDILDALRAADSCRGSISTVGLAASGRKGEELALALGRWGASRVCPLGQMQRPPFAWRHDGRPSLGDLVTWVDWESGSP